MLIPFPQAQAQQPWQEPASSSRCCASLPHPLAWVSVMTLSSHLCSVSLHLFVCLCFVFLEVLSNCSALGQDKRHPARWKPVARTRSIRYPLHFTISTSFPSLSVATAQVSRPLSRCCVVEVEQDSGRHGE